MSCRPLVVLTFALVACGGARGAPHDSSHGGGGAISIAWKATQADNEMVTVVLVVDGTPTTIGQLSAAADDAPGTPATCKIMDDGTPTATTLECGRTPGVNYDQAVLVGKELVVSLVTGVEQGEPKLVDEKHQEIKRIQVHGTTLTVAPFTP